VDAVTTTESDPIADAIEENPEEVARLFRRLGLVNELLDAVDLATAAVDDEMAASLAGTGALLAETADGVATTETASLAESVGANAGELESALDTLLRLERTGTLDDLGELADAASLATSALDDEMVATLARKGGSLGEAVDAAADPDTVQGVEAMLDGIGEASAEEPERVGAIGLLRALRDPDVQRGVGFLVAVARATGEGLDGKPE
jgi:uncharacterized protein YjgD (DUF1641 family)